MLLFSELKKTDHNSLNQFIDSLSPHYSLLGGRRFLQVKGKGSISLNDIVKQLDSIAKSKFEDTSPLSGSEFDQFNLLVEKVKKLDKLTTVKQSNRLTKFFTQIRQWLGNRDLNRQTALQKIKLELPSKIQLKSDNYFILKINDSTGNKQHVVRIEFSKLKNWPNLHTFLWPENFEKKDYINVDYPDTFFDILTHLGQWDKLKINADNWQEIALIANEFNLTPLLKHIETFLISADLSQDDWKIIEEFGTDHQVFDLKKLAEEFETKFLAKKFLETAFIDHLFSNEANSCPSDGKEYNSRIFNALIELKAWTPKVVSIIKNELIYLNCEEIDLFKVFGMKLIPLVLELFRKNQLENNIWERLLHYLTVCEDPDIRLELIKYVKNSSNKKAKRISVSKYLDRQQKKNPIGIYQENTNRDINTLEDLLTTSPVDNNTDRLIAFCHKNKNSSNLNIAMQKLAIISNDRTLNFFAELYNKNEHSGGSIDLSSLFEMRLNYPFAVIEKLTFLMFSTYNELHIREISNLLGTIKECEWTQNPELAKGFFSALKACDPSKSTIEVKLLQIYNNLTQNKRYSLSPLPPLKCEDTPVQLQHFFPSREKEKKLSIDEWKIEFEVNLYKGYQLANVGDKTKKTYEVLKQLATEKDLMTLENKDKFIEKILLLINNYAPYEIEFKDFQEAVVELAFETLVKLDYKDVQSIKSFFEVGSPTVRRCSLKHFGYHLDSKTIASKLKNETSFKTVHTLVYLLAQSDPKELNKTTKLSFKI